MENCNLGKAAKWKTASIFPSRKTLVVSSVTLARTISIFVVFLVGQIFFPASKKIVQDDDFVAIIQELVGQVTANKTRAAGDKIFHRLLKSDFNCRRFFFQV